MSDDGLVEIELGREYGEHAAGAVIRVDPGRAAWLREAGYEAGADVAEPAPKTGRRRAFKVTVDESGRIHGEEVRHG